MKLKMSEKEFYNQIRHKVNPTSGFNINNLYYIMKESTKEEVFTYLDNMEFFNYITEKELEFLKEVITYAEKEKR